MKTIWKFELALQTEQAINMPEGAKVLTVQVQAGVLCVWALVDTENDTEERQFFILGTGHDADDVDSSNGYNYLNTVQLPSGALVHHVFVRAI